MSQTLTKSGRRRLRFNSHEEVLADIRSLAERPTKHLGRWTLPYICQHLATTVNKCIDGDDIDFPVPLRTRIVARILRNHLLKTRIPGGFKLPQDAEAALFHEPASVAAAIADLEKAMARLGNTNRRQPHPVFGRMNPRLWDLFHLRHAELHLSYIVPAEADA
jgi:hypothetical protein